ncbi:MAG: aminotransferase class I/II-fold pyridoxal phosphate-dependent enzyme, partial [Verrucomicrobiota bacterium]
SIEVFNMLSETTELRDKLEQNTKYFRDKMTSAGFDIKPGVHPIVPIMLGDARLAQQMASQLLESGVYAVGFFFPVVPQGKARIRTQVSSALTRADLEQAVSAFVKARAAATK